ncbi:MAG: hypothetical protein ACR2L3_05875 [Actinomycetota bacterium]
MPTARAYLGGTEVTSHVLEGSVTHRWQLNLDEASIRMPSFLTTAGEGVSLDITLNGALDFSGTVELIEDQGAEDRIDTIYTAIEPSFIYASRPARDADGDFSDPSFFEVFATGPQIFQEIFNNSIVYEGAMGVTFGSAAGGGVNLRGAPTNWPMYLSQVGAWLSSTGQVDFVHTPTGGGTSRLDVYNGDFGADTGFQLNFATGSTSNCKGCRRTVDLREICNKKWDYLGPRKNQQQWWGGNITGSVDLPGGAGNPLNSPPYAADQSIIMAAVYASRAAYRTRMEIEHFDQFSNSLEAAVGKPFYLRRWQAESWLRARPKIMVELTPHGGVIPTFKCGDKINVTAGPRFRGGFSGSQRVMEYSYRWGTEGVIELGTPVGATTGAPSVFVTTSAEKPS